MTDPFFPAGCAPPTGLEHPDFRLEPLGPEHNEADFRAWSSSMDHIRSTPGFAGRAWPKEMSLADNWADLYGHARDFAARTGFAYTVLSPEGDTIGCVYLYPSKEEGVDVDVRSWVRADRAELDVVLHDAVVSWMGDAWPFTTVSYASRT